MRLFPPQREQKRIEQESEDDDGEAIVPRDPVEEMQRVKNWDRQWLGDPPQNPIVAEVDQIIENSYNSFLLILDRC